jgi:hypothetical protein
MSAARPTLESFITALHGLKIGNVISISFIENDKCVLMKEAERPQVLEAKRRLP